MNGGWVSLDPIVVPPNVNVTIPGNVNITQNLSLSMNSSTVVSGGNVIVRDTITVGDYSQLTLGADSTLNTGTSSPSLYLLFILS